MKYIVIPGEVKEYMDAIAIPDESPPPKNSPPESIYQRKEMLKIIDGIIEMLPNKQKEAALLFYFKDFSVKQIAEYQHVTEQTVKRRLSSTGKKVEQATKDYEKKNGVKKYSAAIIPTLLVLYFKNSVYASHHESVLNALSTGTCPLYQQ
jgi:predicted DNA-binding protein YlxM (UPF0122 family)